MISKKWSFERFKISRNLKDSLKQSCYILIPALLTELVTNNMLAASSAGAIGKVVLSALEFYSKKKVIQGVTQ